MKKKLEDVNNPLADIIRSMKVMDEKEEAESRKQEHSRRIKEQYDRSMKIIKDSMLNEEKLKFIKSKKNTVLFPKFVCRDVGCIWSTDYIFNGSFGTCKTTLAHLIAIEYLKKAKTVRFLNRYKTKQIASQIASGDLSIDKWVRDYDLVIFDDFGHLSYTDNQLDAINEMMGERGEYGKRTIIIKNVSITKLLSDRTTERVDTTFKILEFDGNSKREKMKNKIINI